MDRPSQPAANIAHVGCGIGGQFCAECEKPRRSYRYASKTTHFGAPSTTAAKGQTGKAGKLDELRIELPTRSFEIMTKFLTGRPSATKPSLLPMSCEFLRTLGLKFLGHHYCRDAQHGIQPKLEPEIIILWNMEEKLLALGVGLRKSRQEVGKLAMFTWLVNSDHLPTTSRNLNPKP